MQPEPSTQSTSDYALDMSPGEKPLQSWKEIAAYMERDVRTARRWEQAEGLPVRRHRGGSRSSVYAYPSEIEAWRAARKPRADTDAAVPVWKRFGPRLAITASVFMAALAVLRGPILNPSDPVAEAAKAGGVQLNQVWTGPKVDFHRSVSADGRYVSYVDSKADSGPNLALHDLLEDKDRLLTHNNFEETPGFPVYSVISPDGKQVAYTWRNNETRIHELRIVSTTGKSGTDPQLVYTNTETPDLRPQAWFPDGRRILAQIGTKDKTNQIVVISLDDGSLEVIKSLEWRWPQNLGLSPDGRHIVYDAAPNQDSPQRDIYLLAVDGSREISLIKHSADEAWADWSPDGGHIFFTSDRTGTASLWSIAMSGIQPNGPAQLIKRDLGFDRVLTGGLTTSGSLYFEANSSTRDLFIAELDWRTGKTIAEPAKIAVRVEGANSEPQWSPDGSRLAYLARNPHRRSPSSFGLVIHTLTTGEEQTLDLGIELEGERPHWSPDGTLIMIAGADGRRRSLYGIDPQSGRSHLLVRFPTDSYFVDPVWAADGESIICREHRDGGFRIVAYPVNSGEPRTLYSRTRAEVGIKRLAISPDGRWLAFRENHIGAAVIKLLSTAGGKTRELTRIPDGAMTVGSTFEFTPDSNYLVYGQSAGGEDYANPDLWRISLEGGAPVRMDLTAEGLEDLSFQPNSNRAAFTAGHSVGELWAMEGFLPETRATQ